MSVRDCYSCAHSPRWEGPHTIAGCAAVDPEGPDPKAMVAWADAAGCDDDGWPRPGNTIPCPGWRQRSAIWERFKGRRRL